MEERILEQLVPSQRIIAPERSWPQTRNACEAIVATLEIGRDIGRNVSRENGQMDGELILKDAQACPQRCTLLDRKRQHSCPPSGEHFEDGCMI